jgi:hypothetical protein
MRKLIAALLIGLLLAFIFTSYNVKRPCNAAEVPTGESTSHCVAFERQYVSLGDLLHNNESRLVRFAGFFAINSIFCFVLINRLIQQRQSRPKKGDS